MRKPEQKIKVPGWADTLVEVIEADEGFDGTLQIYENKVRPIILQPKTAKRYTANYNLFIDRNCVGCVSGLPDCPYMEKQADKVQKIYDILEGKETERCQERVSGTIGVRVVNGKSVGEPFDIDLRSN